MKFEDLPEQLQYLAAETLKSILSNSLGVEHSLCVDAAINVRDSFFALLGNTPTEKASGDLTVRVLEILQADTRLTVVEAIERAKADLNI